jgi:hypothetical protein
LNKEMLMTLIRPVMGSALTADLAGRPQVTSRTVLPMTEAARDVAP